MSNPAPQPQKDSFFVRLLRLIGNLVVAVVLGLALGAALFFGIPAVYRQFIQPVRDHTVQIRLLEANQASAATQAASQNLTLTSRLEALEKQNDANKAAAAELLTLKAALSTAEAQLGALQTSSAADHLALATASAGQQRAQASLDNSKQIIITSVESLSARIDALATAQAENASSRELGDQLRLLRAMQLVLRAEFYMAQNNFGLAKQDTQTALGMLKELSASLPAAQAASVQEAAGYLESALAGLPDRPVVVNAQLETAWQVLLGYTATATPTPTPLTAALDVTATLTQTITTPTPLPAFTITPTASATPTANKKP